MINEVRIEGIWQEAPELKAGSADGSVILATGRIIHRRERAAGEPVTYYFNILGRNEIARAMAAFRAGEGCLIEGRLQVHSWVDPTTQFKRTIFEIYATSVEKRTL